MPYYVYMLRCSDSTYYVGSTTDLSRRFAEHEAGANPNSYTFSRRPVKMVWAQEFATHEEAFASERQIKGWSRAKKEALIQDDWAKIHQIVREERKRREQEKRKSNGAS